MTRPSRSRSSSSPTGHDGKPETGSEQSQDRASAEQFRFRPDNRLLKASDYDRVFSRATRSQDRYFTVLFRHAGSNSARLGLAIAKKHCKLATGRNRIKRLVRESFRQHQPELRGLDIVVMNTRATHTAANDTLRQSLERHWTRRPKRRNGKTRN